MTTKTAKNTNGHTPKLMKHYRDAVIPELVRLMGYRNAYEAPRLQKIVINMGVKEGAQDIKLLDQVAHELGQIAGQKPVVTRAKKSISAFHLKQGMPIGLKVTLRGKRMYEFLERLLQVAMPRIRDFRGYALSSFDDQGNYTFGIQEQMIFPEVDFEKVKKTQGMDVTFVTSANHKDDAKALLELLGFPFRKQDAKAATNKG